MSFSEILEANVKYADHHVAIDSAFPRKRLAVVTCMDARIDVFAAFGLAIGDAHVIRNAGARVTDDVVRSLAVSSHVLETNALLLVQHTGCGMASATQEHLEALTGSRIEFLTIDDHKQALVSDIERLQSEPSLARLHQLSGAVFDLASGELRVEVERNR